VRELLIETAAAAGGGIGTALVNYVSRPGKMLRPAMVILGSWSGKHGATTHILEIAAAVETLHLATLIHDDVIDDADKRRGGPALHTLYGKKQAVLMGDYLLAQCFSIITDGTTRENALRLATATSHMVRGELNQMEDAGRLAFSKRAYLRRIAAKTAMLFGLSLVTGASESKAPRREVALLARIGYASGIAFQIIDDILDLTATEQHLGKPVASDLRAGNFTLPVIEAAASDPSLIELITSLRKDTAVDHAGLASPERERGVSKLIDRIERAGGLAAARRSAALYTARARKAASRLSTGEQRDALQLLIQKLLDRSY
jgi:heptaprenyl diphosphate synthase